VEVAMSAVAVLGCGSFGTTLAVHAASVTDRVVLWARRPELAEELAARRENALYLPGIELPPAVEPTADLAAAAGCELVLVAIPSHGFRDALRGFLAAAGAAGRVSLVSLAKGIEEGSLARMSEVAAEEAAAAGRELSFAVLSGPCFAVELARGAPTAAVVASADAGFATTVQRRLATASLRLYSSQDVVGVELAAAAKNVIAIAAGVVAGLGLGHNALAALITRGLHEIARLGLAYGGEPPTFSGLAGLGDLVLTCTGEPSRNRRTGIELAAGRSLEQITGGTRMVAEGIRTSRAVARLAERKGVAMPITEQVVALLYEGKDPRQAVTELMTRELKPEAKL
jgi:glycerol-3-phosphate dehydrogenase (NAD(P)+)